MLVKFSISIEMYFTCLSRYTISRRPAVMHKLPVNVKSKSKAISRRLLNIFFHNFQTSNKKISKFFGAFGFGVILRMLLIAITRGDGTNRRWIWPTIKKSIWEAILYFEINRAVYANRPFVTKIEVMIKLTVG